MTGLGSDMVAYEMETNEDFMKEHPGEITEWGKEFNKKNIQKSNKQSTKSAQDLIDELN